MQRVVPALRITNYERSKAFYVNGLGFTIDWEHRFEPGFPVFMQVSREGLIFYLSEHTGDCQPGGLVHLMVDDVDAWHRDIVSRGVQPAQPPTDEPWGLRDMNIIDPDGNQIRVCSRVRG
jgi:catechol 2,3-dioxygenase-like lactoylglutathione lyase family enzyme